MCMFEREGKESVVKEKLKISKIKEVISRASGRKLGQNSLNVSFIKQSRSVKSSLQLLGALYLWVH